MGVAGRDAMCDTPPEYPCTQTSVAHTPAQESLWCVRLNTYQEHRHNCNMIHKPMWLESIHHHHRWFFTEIGGSGIINCLRQHGLGAAPIHRDLTGLLFLA